MVNYIDRILDTIDAALDDGTIKCHCMLEGAGSSPYCTVCNPELLVIDDGV